MEQELFALLAHAMAEDASGYRKGARHAMIFIACAADLDEAEGIASAMAEESGWAWIEFRKGAKVDPREEKMRGTLADAIANAEQTGKSMIVYSDEIPLDS